MIIGDSYPILIKLVLELDMSFFWYMFWSWDKLPMASVQETLLLNNFMVLTSFLIAVFQKPWKFIEWIYEKDTHKKHVKVFCNKVEFQLNSKPMTLFPLPALTQPF